jgi:predicted ATPase/class 3 adenylate cyclase
LPARIVGSFARARTPDQAFVTFDTQWVSARPVGTVTLLFTDIEGSTRLLHELGDRYVDVLAEHRRALRTAVAEHHGVEVDTQGDAFFIVFAKARDAVAAACAAQLALARSPVRVRMGIHTGTPAVTPEGYVGVDVHRGARICAAGHGGQILISKTTRDALPSAIGLRDLGEHRLKDLQTSEWIFQITGPDLEPHFPPLRSLSNTNLPAEATTFIGRERELAEMSAALGRDDVRLLTLTGAGGSGKTRLSLRLAAEYVEYFKNGVFVVSLAPVSDPQRVLEVIADTLGAREAPAEALADRLRRHLEGKHVLLVLDNFEHLLAAAADVSALLAAAPKVKLIVSSRERLRLTGEHEFPVSPLLEDEAVKLFEVRARAAKPSFIAELEREAIVAICRRLDGLPLAIELAAARVKVLPPRALLARLDQRLPLLTGGPRDMPDRQQTLRATIDWSYRLLEVREQEIFARLAVFVGGFTAEAAEAVTGATLDELAALLDQSLLRSHDEPNGDRRFSMLETIREYALEKLEVLDGSGSRLRHADLFLRPVEQLNTWTLLTDLLRLRERMRSDLDNVRAALHWVIDTGNSRRAVWPGAGAARMLGGAEARNAMNTILSLPTTEQESLSRAKALVMAAHIAMPFGDLARAHALFDEAWAITTGHADDAHIALCLRGRSHLAFVENDYERAESLDEQHLHLRNKHGIEPDAGLLITLAGVARDRGAFERADALYRDALARSRTTADRAGIAGALSNQGELAFMVGDTTRARALIAEALSIAPIDDFKFVAHVKLAAVEQFDGENESAARHAHDALQLFPAVRDLRHLAICLDVVVGIAVSLGRAETACALIGATDALRERIASPVPAGFREVRNRNVALARDALGENVFAAERTKGRLLTTDEALASAIEITHAAVTSAPVKRSQEH